MSHSERFAWVKPWRMVWVLMVPVAVLLVPAGLQFWRLQAVKELVRAVESDNSLPAFEAALGKVRERKATELAVQRLIELLERTTKKGPAPGMLKVMVPPPTLAAVTAARSDPAPESLVLVTTCARTP